MIRLAARRSRWSIAVVVVAIVVVVIAVVAREYPASPASDLLQSDVASEASLRSSLGSRLSPAATLPMSPARARRADTQPLASRELADADDYLEFVRRILPSAVDGDADAQLAIALALQECQPARVLFAEGKRPEDILSRGDTSSSRHAGVQSLWTRCAGLLRSDVFQSTDDPGAAAEPKYWMRRAVEGGSSLALALQTLAESVAWPSTEPLSAAARARISTTLEAALSEPDPRALLYAGAVVGQRPASRTLGAAMMLTACELGAECEEGRLISPMQYCGHTNDPTCVPGATLADALRSSLGPEAYARVFALSTELQDEIRSGQHRLVLERVERALAPDIEH